VGRDVLFGAVLGVVWCSIFVVHSLVMNSLGAAPGLGGLDYFLGARRAVGAILYHIPNSILFTLMFFFIIFLLRVLLRKQWLAAAAFTLIYTALATLGTDHPVVTAPFEILIYAIAAVVVVRLGLVALAAGIFTADLLGNLPHSTDFSAWYATTPLLALVVVVAMAIWGFRTSLAGRPLLKQELFE